MTRHLIVAATRAEVAHLPEGLEVIVTGIGKTAAATGLTRHLAGRTDLDDLILVNVGTAGALHDGMDAETGLFEIGEVINHEISADAIRALGFDPRERLSLGDASTVLATGDMFVTDPVVRTRLAAQAQLVDMEGYAYAWVAQEFGVPIRMVKHVSDSADESAMAWVDVVDHSAQVLGAWVATHLD